MPNNQFRKILFEKIFGDKNLSRALRIGYKN